jgi:hypothetical protein|tara:strand:+ start:632 stop:1057 length:426 start_codon:yes stop_codon:yes gene_type:complete
MITLEKKYFLFSSEQKWGRKNSDIMGTRRMRSGFVFYFIGKACRVMGSKKVEVICPCCESKLQVDKKTGEVLWEQKKEIAMPSLSDMVKGLDSQKREQESQFKKQNETQKERNRLLNEKFKEAQKHVDKSDTRPLRDFDLD